MYHKLACNRIVPFFLALGLFVAPLASAEVIELDTSGLKQLIAKGVPVVDIRRTDEWQQTGVIKGGHLITYFQDKEQKVYDTEAWLASVHKLATPDQPVVLICRSGKRSGHVAKLLDQQAGYKKVYNVAGGITGWIGEGSPVVPYKEKK